MTLPVFTIGHSTRALEEFIGLLGEAGVELLVDVRAFPRSRRQPQFNTETMPEALGPAGIGYAHLPALGGRRGSKPGPSPNTGWREEAFRAYADHALTPEFRAGFEEMRRLAGSLQIDSSKIRTELGWSSRLNLIGGLDQTAQWYYSQFPAKSNT